MNPATLFFELLPYAERGHKAYLTFQRLMADPDVKDAIELFGEITARIAAAQKQELAGVQGGQ